MATIRACGVMGRFGVSLRTLLTPPTRYRYTKRPIISFRSLSGSTDGESPVLSNVNVNNEDTFPEMMAKSRLLTSCGSSPVGHRALGKVIGVVDDNLYIDFGGKFHGVVPCPELEADVYTVDTLVEVIVKDLEMSEHFLGDPQDSSLLEAEIRLVGLLTESKMNLITDKTDDISKTDDIYKTDDISKTDDIYKTDDDDVYFEF